MTRDEMVNARLRRASSGKIFVIWQGEPICAAGGSLRYFEDEDDALDFLERCDLVEIIGAAAA